MKPMPSRTPKSRHGLFGRKRKPYHHVPTAIDDIGDKELAKALIAANKKNHVSAGRVARIHAELKPGPVAWEPGVRASFLNGDLEACRNPACRLPVGVIETRYTDWHGTRKWKLTTACEVCNRIFTIQGWRESRVFVR